jgi:PAS domain S-box-containing protein
LELVQRIPLLEDRPRLDAALKGLLLENKAYDIEFTICRYNDHAHRIIHSVAQLKLNDLGAPVKVIGILQDITELKQVELSLIESEQRYRSLFQNNHAIMLLVDPQNGIIKDANPAASDFYGWTYEELTRMNVSSINTLPEEAILKSIRALVAPTSKPFQFQHRKKNGQISDVEVFSGPILVKDQPFLFSIVHDITDRKQAETQAAEQLDELRRWHRVTLDRENRVLELKKEVNQVLTQFGMPPRYTNGSEDAAHD